MLFDVSFDLARHFWLVNFQRSSIIAFLLAEGIFISVKPFLSKLALISLPLFSSGCFLLLPFVEPYEEPPPQGYATGGYYQTGGQPKKAYPKVSKYVSRYTKQMSDKDERKRTEAASYLGMLGPDAAPAIPTLIASSSDQSKRVRRASVKALGKIGVKSDDVIDALSHASRDRDPFVAASASKSLRQLRGGERIAQNEISEKGPRMGTSPMYTAR